MEYEQALIIGKRRRADAAIAISTTLIECTICAIKTGVS
jgi:hypothetical protein